MLHPQAQHRITYSSAETCMEDVFREDPGFGVCPPICVTNQKKKRLSREQPNVIHLFIFGVAIVFTCILAYFVLLCKTVYLYPLF